MESFGFDDWPGVAVVYADQFNTEIWSLLGEARQQSPATLAPQDSIPSHDWPIGAQITYRSCDPATG